MEWLSYLLKASACTALFYGFYHFFLQKLTFFAFNRYYLLLTLALSLLIPLLQMEVVHVVAVEKMYVSAEDGSYAMKGGSVSRTSELATAKTVYIWKDLILYVYIGISTVLLLVFAFRIFLLLKPLRFSSKKIGTLKVIHKPDGFTNCSFFNYVFVADADLSETELAILLQHEGEHSRKYHSLDKLFIAGCRIVLWFNPFIYLYERALELIHEYEADQEASNVVGEHPYAELLLKMAIKGRKSAMVHHFALVPVKERIKMLLTTPSKKMKRFIYLATVPMLAILLWSFSVVPVYKPDLSVARVIYQDSSGKAHSIKPSRQNETVAMINKDNPVVLISSETIKKENRVSKAPDSASMVFEVEKKVVGVADGEVADPIVGNKKDRFALKSSHSVTMHNKLGIAFMVGAEMISDELKITAEELECNFNIKIGLAKNVTVYSLKTEQTVTGAYAKINLTTGTYELLKSPGTY